MGMLLNGRWTQDDQALTEVGGRPWRHTALFRDWVADSASATYRPEPGRYHLYVSLACPWAHRCLIVRALRGLEDVLSVGVVDPLMGPDGWQFSDRPGCDRDEVNGARYLREIYLRAKPKYTGRVTVPVLWDRTTETIVSNESREIVRMLSTAFNRFARPEVDLLPTAYRQVIDHTIDALHAAVNEGVYEAGLAPTQEAYERAVRHLFAALDQWERVLSDRRYLCGRVLTEADICLFVTLLRFDPVYFTLFKCNLRRLVDYPNLFGYTREIYQLPGVAETCNLDHIKRHYYWSFTALNPRRIVAAGPVMDLALPHDRARLPGRPPTGLFESA
jgi:glutathionyl-hydroquinone reductase